MNSLTPNEEEYFRILESMEPDAQLRRAIAATKEDLRSSNRRNQLVLGESRTIGFQVEPRKKD